MSERKDALPPGTERWMEALTWHETLADAATSDLTSAVVREWQTWHADAENQRAFDCVTRLTVDGQLAPGAECATSTRDDYDPAVPVAQWLAMRQPRPAARNRPPESARRWRLLLAGIAVAAMASIAALILWPFPRTGAGGATWGEGAASYETSVGGLRDVHLDDGSNITLSGDTKLLVTFTKQIRSVRLIQGEAWFRVAHDPQWPFIVQAGEGDIRAVGTAFLVTRDSDRVVVTVTEGTVAVTAPPPVAKGAPGSSVPRAPMHVTRGEEISYRDNGVVATTVTADTRAATAWTRGRLVFDNEPLRYVVENVNRYFPKHISITPSAGELRFSGVIISNEIQDWLGGLSQTFPVIVSDRSTSICVRMRAAESDGSCDAAP